MNRENHKVDLMPLASLASGDDSHPAGGTILHPTDYSASSRQAFELAFASLVSAAAGWS